MQVTVTLDGTKILDSATDSLTPWFFPAQTFSAPIMYSAPTSYGSIGAIWVKGIGILHKPLPRGTHVLRVNELNTAHNLGFDNTWNVTVP